MKTNLKLVILILFVCAHQATAYTPREGQVNLVVGPIIHQTPLTKSSTDLKSPYKGGFGLILLGDLDDLSSLDLTFMLLNKTYFRSSGSLILAEETDLVHIGLGYRRHLTNIFSTALLLYSSYSAGDIRVNHLSQPNTEDLKTSAHDKVDYGFDLSVSADLFNTERYSFFTDLRYSLGITPRSNENADQTTLLIGLRYRLQEGSVADKLKP